jgi:hypothetical protein
MSGMSVDGANREWQSDRRSKACSERQAKRSQEACSRLFSSSTVVHLFLFYHATLCQIIIFLLSSFDPQLESINVVMMRLPPSLLPPDM